MYELKTEEVDRGLIMLWSGLLIVSRDWTF